MLTRTLLVRFLGLAFSMALFAALIGFSLGARRGLWVAEALALGIGFLGAMTAESGICWAYGGRLSVFGGPARSLARVLARQRGVAPRILACPDTSVFALVVRSPFSRGTILLSEGLLGLLSEDELRALLEASLSRLRGRGMVFQSFCAWWARLALAAAPRPWAEFWLGELRWHEGLRPLQALRFSVSFAIAQFFIFLGQPVRAGESIGLSAAQSYRRLSGWNTKRVNPEATLLLPL
ncbi:hypothetical protein WDW37_18105 [Bdellovibrionota bacterium FG-1]